MWQHHEGVDCFLSNSEVIGSVAPAAVLLMPEPRRWFLSLAFASMSPCLRCEDAGSGQARCGLVGFPLQWIIFLTVREMGALERRCKEMK